MSKVTPPPTKGSTTGSFSNVWDDFVDAMNGQLATHTDPNPESQPELPEEDDSAAAHQAAAAYLQNNLSFQSLPQQLQAAILSFAALAISLAGLMQANLITSIVIGNIPGGEGRFLNGVLTIKTELANAVVNGITSAQRDLFKTISHEMGHAVAEARVDIDHSNKNSYVDSYITKEALAVISNLLTWHSGIINDIDVSTTGAGDADDKYKEMYVDFLASGDMGALVGAIKGHMYIHSTYPAYYGGYYDALYPPQNP